jgi:hypothetical protein
VEDDANGDALQRVRVATALASELASLGDAVVNHFVEQAREEGRSWADIGEVLGMTKQAAQQRFRVRWFDRLIGRRGVPWMEFTDRARRVVEVAAQEARSLNHNYLGTEHLLLAILRDKDSVGARALRDLGVSLTTVRRKVEQKIGRGDVPVTGNVPYTPRAKHALYGAREEAKALGHNYVGTEHLLLALSRLQRAVAAEILSENGITHQELRQSLLAILSRDAF